VAAYRLVADVLSGAGPAVTRPVTIGLHFRDDALELGIALEESCPDWPDAATRDLIMRCDGQISRSVLGTGDQITVALPRHAEAAAR
jgi:hypothetical protein